MSFLKPVFVGDQVTLYAHVVSTGRSSMRIFVEAWRRARLETSSQKVTEATFVFVAIDDHRRPIALPAEPAAG